MSFGGGGQLSTISLSMYVNCACVLGRDPWVIHTTYICKRGDQRCKRGIMTKKTEHQDLPTVDHSTDDSFFLHRGNWSPFLWLFPAPWVRAAQVRDGKTILLAFWECCWHESGRQMCYFKVSWGRKTDKRRVAVYTGYLVFMFNATDFVKFDSEFATLETRRELEPKCVPKLFMGSLLGIVRSAIGQFPPLPPSLATVPEVFAKVNSSQFPFRIENGVICWLYVLALSHC